MGTPTAHGAKDLAAASLLRAFLADDREAGILIMEQNGGRLVGPEGAEMRQLMIALTKLAARCLLSANGYDPARTRRVLDQWLTRLAAGADVLPGPPDPLP
jgi:hypothetical protein